MTTSRRRLRSLLLVPALAGVIGLAACTGTPPSAPGAAPTSGAVTPSSGQATPGVGEQGELATAASILSAAGLGAAGQDPRGMVEALEATALEARPAGLTASITADRLELADGSGATASVPLEGFYLSVAPFTTTTHECTFHAPAGCRGELRGADVDVLIKDADTGEVLVQEGAKTADNGFVGFWLPRDRTVSVAITADGRTGTVTTGTGADDPTCLTTLRLS